jgi:hypothetical protein
MFHGAFRRRMMIAHLRRPPIAAAALIVASARYSLPVFARATACPHAERGPPMRVAKRQRRDAAGSTYVVQTPAAQRTVLR